MMPVREKGKDGTTAQHSALHPMDTAHLSVSPASLAVTQESFNSQYEYVIWHRRALHGRLSKGLNLQPSTKSKTLSTEELCA